MEVRVNGQAAADMLVVRRDADGALLLKATDLPRLRMKAPERGAVVVNGERYYRVGAEIGASVAFDETAQSVSVTLPAAAFESTNAGMLAQASPRPAKSGLGGFVNYEVTAEQVTHQQSAGGLVELGAFAGSAVLTSTAVASSRADRKVVRLDTTWTHDFPDHMATLRIGDAITSSGAWGRAARFGGVQFGTNFSTQPTLVTTPFLAATGEAVVPSTVDVFINGQPVASQTVPPGPFTLENLPAITGSGQMQVVVTDALGRQQVISQPYYSGPMLLRAGLQEYSAEIGAIRRDYGNRSDSYGSLVAAGTYRRGITNTLTAEVHGEAQADGARAFGVDTAWQLGQVGVLSLTAAAGADDDGSGWLSGVGIEHSGGRVSVFARSEFASQSFAQLGSQATADRMRNRTFGGVGFDFARFGNAQLAYGAQTFWNAERVRTLGLSYSVTLGAYGFLNLFVSRTVATDATTNVLLGWTMPFGDRRTVSAAVTREPDMNGKQQLAAVATVQQSLPVGSGHGYFVSAETSQQYQMAYAYQGSAGRVGLDAARRNGQNGIRADAAGGLAITAAGFMPSRWLDGSFAVVQVEDYPGLTVYVENQPVGHTDANGRVLLDRLRPYESNQVSIDPLELPMDASLEAASMNVTPTYRSGPLVSFPVRRSRAATLTLRLPDGRPVPAGARVTVADRTYPVALDGLVYIENAGEARLATADWPGNHCRFAIDRPQTLDPAPDLGDVTCRAATE
jgi:outer membrane usher protein